jgi:DNA-directed RNA polymerase specialized sigma24 family protein
MAISQEEGDAFDQRVLAQPQWDAVVGLLRRKGSLCREDAEDLAGNVLLGTARAALRHGALRNLDAYLYVAARSKLISFLASKDRAQSRITDSVDALGDGENTIRGLWISGLDAEDIMNTQKVHAAFLFAARQYLRRTPKSLPSLVFLAKEFGLWDESWILRFFEHHLAKVIADAPLSRRRVDLDLFCRRYYWDESYQTMVPEVLCNLEPETWQQRRGSRTYIEMKAVLTGLQTGGGLSFVKSRLHEFRKWMKVYFESSGYQILVPAPAAGRKERPVARRDGRTA